MHLPASRQREMTNYEFRPRRGHAHKDLQVD